MKILFEDYVYKTEAVSDILGSFMQSGLEKTKETTLIKYVGYFYNKDIENANHGKGDLVFFLPKVLLDEPVNGGTVKTAFGLPVESFLNFDLKTWKNNKDLQTSDLSKDKIYRFVYGFSTWIYRAVDVYVKNLNAKKNNQREEVSEVIKSDALSSLNVKTRGTKSEGTFIDVMLALIDFQRENKNFILFTIKSTHSGQNKINWQKTISHTIPFIQDETPIYMNLVNKKKFIDFDEELLIIYYSILNYMHEEYGFPKVEHPGYDIIKGMKFRSMLNNVGKMRLRRIKNKYFSDSAVLLWNLCYSFFDYASELKGSDREDYLLVNSFYCVFEAMIDELLGDKNLPYGLKTQRDDKRIDHLYTYKYLLERMEDATSQNLEKDIYNIADSKYYRRDKELRGHDVPKQFTYARNVTQWHMDLLHDLLYQDDPIDIRKKNLPLANKYRDIPLFDTITEGYNIIPNFFISAIVDNELNYNNKEFRATTLGNKGSEKKDYVVKENYQFWERLFDRDSLFTLHYDVNFLYVLKLYAQNRSTIKTAWTHEVRGKFRKNILEYLNQEYEFYQVMIEPANIQDYVERNYRKLVGKVFSFESIEGNRVLLYAERKNQNDYDKKGYKFDKEKHSRIVCNSSHDVKMLFVPGEDKNYQLKDIILGKEIYDIVTKDLVGTPYVNEEKSGYEDMIVENPSVVSQYGIKKETEMSTVAEPQFEYNIKNKNN